MKSNKQIKKIIKTKKNFLLIEILIAISLITMLTIPLIRNPIFFCRSQIKSIEKIECERIADLTFLDIKLKFYKNQIDISNIQKYEEKASKSFLKPYFLDSLKNKKIKRSYKMYSKKEKLTPNNEIYKLVHLKIFLQPQDEKKPYVYKYKLVCQKNLKKS